MLCIISALIRDHICIFRLWVFSMDWESARKYCTDRNWKWSVEFIDQAQKETQELEAKIKKLEDQQKAHRLYNSCNY